MFVDILSEMLVDAPLLDQQRNSCHESSEEFSWFEAIHFIESN